MKSKILLHTQSLVETYKYRPLPKELSVQSRSLYESCLNGFEGPVKRSATIAGVQVCRDYNRVVVGDYGAYLEFDKDALLVELDVPPAQRWRLNDEYIKAKGLSIKYRWYEYQGQKVYLQVAGVKYADYQPDKYYISVLDFDEKRKHEDH